MNLKSMTGFSRTQGELEGASWYWELRSVNGRGLDVRTRLGTGMDALDTHVRAAVSGSLKRGNVNVTLNVKRDDGAVQVRLNEAALAQVIAAAKKVGEVVDCAPLRAEGLLGLKGVLESVEVEDGADVVAARLELLKTTFQAALDDLVSSRELEGQGLAKVVSAQFDEIERLVGVVEKSDARKPASVRARIKEQLSRILDEKSELDDPRLYQEAALLATRADVEEELKRLLQHIEAGRGLLSSGGAVGRKFDFLAQEFNREANTLCSKANDGEVSEAGLALKVVVDQMREQVQNIE